MRGTKSLWPFRWALPSIPLETHAYEQAFTRRTGVTDREASRDCPHLAEMGLEETHKVEDHRT